MVLDHSHTKAILIGNGRYENWPEGEIRNIRVNLEKLKSVLCDPKYIGIKDDPKNIVELPDCSKVTILVKISDFINKCLPEDNLIIYYAGHGLLDIEDMKELYLATADTRVDTDKSITCIPSEALKKQLIKCKAANKIMILDCCYAGKIAGLQSDPASLNANYWGNTEGVYFMMSSDAGKPSRFDPNDDNIPTFFTQKLVQTIAEGANSNNEIWTLNELFDLMKQSWDTKIAPMPVNLTFREVGNMPFCYNSYRLMQSRNSKKTDEQRRWYEIESDPTDERIGDFIDSCEDDDLKQVAKDYRRKLSEDWTELAKAIATGMFDPLIKFLITNDPLPPVAKVASDKISSFNAKVQNNSLNIPGRRTRTDSRDRAGGAASGSIHAPEQ